MNKILFVFVLFFTFCGTKKQTVNQEISDIPYWVKNYPVLDGYYVGIGIADKSSHPENFIQIAQQNALQNLSSQIKVNIASESVFLQLEREYGFEEDFKSNIKIQANEYLEGYELEGTFTQKNEYWVFYKLNKEKHNEIQNARKFEAIELAKSHLSKAIDSYSTSKEKYLNFVSALNVLKPYLSEPLQTTFDRKNVFLGSEIISSFRSFADDFKLRYTGKKIKVMIGDKVGNIDINVVHEDNPVNNIDLTLLSDHLKVEKFSNKTNEKGNFTAVIPKITSTEPVQKIAVAIDFSEWLNLGTQDEFIRKLINSIQTQEINIPIYVYTPNIYVKSLEKHFNKDTNSSDLKFAAESSLSKLGFTAVSQKKDADLIMTILSNTEKGKNINGQKMFTAFLDLSIQVKDQNGMVVFSDQVNKIKGIQLDFEQANTDAYKNAKNDIKERLIPDFVSSFTK